MHEAIKQTTSKRPEPVSLQNRADFDRGTGATQGEIGNLKIPLRNREEGRIKGRSCQSKEAICQKTERDSSEGGKGKMDKELKITIVWFIM